MNRQDTHLLSLSMCENCELVQLSEFPSEDIVRPRVPWIRYREPEMHLDSVLANLQTLRGSGAEFDAIGVGPFDSPILERLTKSETSCRALDFSAYMVTEGGRYPYLESIQQLLRPDVLIELAKKQSKAEFVSCRYLIEHCHDPILALRSLRHVLKANGILLIEIPDCTKFIARLDYSFVWEEHICYFTEETFRKCANLAGYRIEGFSRFEGLLEDSLVFFLRRDVSENTEDKFSIISNSNSSVSKACFLRYIRQFKIVQQQYISAIAKMVMNGHKIALFGVGHQSIIFVNAMQLTQFIACAVDDSIEKVGCFLPGTSIEIVSSAQLFDDESIDVCLLGISGDVFKKIKTKFLSYLNRGSRVYSIFSGDHESTLIDDGKFKHSEFK